jgi:hypothetical protein
MAVAASWLGWFKNKAAIPRLTRGPCPVFGVRRHRRGFAPRFENRRGQPGRQAAVRRPAVQLQPTDPAGGKQLGDADRVARTETESADRSGRFGRADAAALQGRPISYIFFIIYSPLSMSRL